jgi:hypothetical protein
MTGKKLKAPKNTREGVGIPPTFGKKGQIGVLTTGAYTGPELERSACGAGEALGRGKITVNLVVVGGCHPWPERVQDFQNKRNKNKKIFYRNKRNKRNGFFLDPYRGRGTHPSQPNPH